jgi:hypothetical protein
MQNELNFLNTETSAVLDIFKQTDYECNLVKEEYKEWKRKPYDEMHREVQSLKNAIVLISNHNRLLREKIGKQVI